MGDAFENWMATQTELFLFLVTRLSGLVIAAPLSWTFAPIRIRAAFVLVTAFACHGALDGHRTLPGDVLGMGLGLVSEFAFGVALGFVARLVIAVGEVAADAIAPVMGLAGAQMFDPSLGGQGTVLTRLLRYLGLLVALLVGLHHTLLAALFQSFRVLPPGALVNPASLTRTISDLVVETIRIGVQLALPIMAILFIAQVGLAFVARAAPAMQIFAIGFAVTLGTGALLWVVFAPDIIARLSELRAWAEAGLLELLKNAATGGP